MHAYIFFSKVRSELVPTSLHFVQNFLFPKESLAKWENNARIVPIVLKTLFWNFWTIITMFHCESDFLIFNETDFQPNPSDFVIGLQIL